MLLQVHHEKLEEFHIFYLSKILRQKGKPITYFIMPIDFLSRNDIMQLSPIAWKTYVQLTSELLKLRQVRAKIETKYIQTLARIRPKHIQELANTLEWFHIVILDSGVQQDYLELELELEEKEELKEGIQVSSKKVQKKQGIAPSQLVSESSTNVVEHNKKPDFYINDADREVGLEMIEKLNKNLENRY